MESPWSLAAITHQAARLSMNSAMASYVAKAPRNCVGPSTANNAAAKKAARPPKRRVVLLQSSAVAPSMKARLSRRAPTSPPTLSASAPSGGYKTGAPENQVWKDGTGDPCSQCAISR